MKRTQVSTNIGWLSIVVGILSAYNDIKLVDFMDIFKTMTVGGLVTMLSPIAIGVWAILHNEKAPKVYKLRAKSKH